MKAIIVVCGPTAAGKSALGLELARALGVAIIAADSRQVYRGFDIGTAKPTIQERQLVEHRLIDVAEPTEPFNVARYQEMALAEVQTQHSASRPALLVGGTGLYLRSVAGGLTPPAVPPDLELRKRLAGQSLESLVAQLEHLDPETAARLHPNDRVRIERAIEVCLSGQPMSRQLRPPQATFPALWLGLGSDRQALLERIEARTARMLSSGWLSEVEHLRGKYGPDLPLLGTLGYSELGSYLEGRMSLTQAAEQIVVRTRQFAKRQMTWFRAEKQIHWLDAEGSAAPEVLFHSALEQVEKFLSHRNDPANNRQTQ